MSTEPRADEALALIARQGSAIHAILSDHQDTLRELALSIRSHHKRLTDMEAAIDSLRIGSPDAEEAYANGRLIKTSPKLLKACRSVLGLLREGPVQDATAPYGGGYAIAELEAAIAEAEEES